MSNEPIEAILESPILDGNDLAEITTKHFLSPGRDITWDNFLTQIPRTAWDRLREEAFKINDAIGIDGYSMAERFGLDEKTGSWMEYGLVCAEVIALAGIIYWKRDKIKRGAKYSGEWVLSKNDDMFKRFFHSLYKRRFKGEKSERHRFDRFYKQMGQLLACAKTYCQKQDARRMIANIVLRSPGPYHTLSIIMADARNGVPICDLEKNAIKLVPGYNRGCFAYR